MSQENVDSVRRIMAAIGEGDSETLMELTHPEVEWLSFFAALRERGEYRGHAAVAQYLRDLDDAFDVIRPEAEQMLDLGDLVVAVGRIRYRGRASGVETEEPAGWVFRFKDGKGVTFRAFRDPERALAAVGLEGGAQASG